MANIKELKKSAKHSKSALYELGICYFEGKGAPENKKKAFKCFLKGAKKFSDSLAYAKLVECYKNGYGCKISKEKASKYKALISESYKKTNEKVVGTSSKKEVFAECKFTDTPKEKFFKSHTILVCPNCYGDLDILKSESNGKLREDYANIFVDYNGNIERINYFFTAPTDAGETLTTVFECSNCKLKYERIHNLTQVDGVEKCTLTQTHKISYTPLCECSSLVEKTFREASGSFTEKF